jgi:hypothetical protein
MPEQFDQPLGQNEYGAEEYGEEREELKYDEDGNYEQELSDAQIIQQKI